jgi:hypothetical protein
MYVETIASGQLVGCLLPGEGCTGRLLWICDLEGAFAPFLDGQGHSNRDTFGTQAAEFALVLDGDETITPLARSCNR